MSAAEAVRAGTKSGVSPDQQPGPPDASLRLVTVKSPSGARLSAKPTWVLTWRNSAPAVRGPVTMTEQERRAIADSLECVFVVTVDPESRAATNAAQFCERK
jgi:hypothetical protein